MIEIIKFMFSEEKLMKEAFSIRKKVFVIEQDVSEEEEYEYEEESTHFLLRYNKTPVATARYRKTKEGIKLERFAVLQKYRGKGIGFKILESMLYDLKDNTSLKYMHAQIQVVPFYEKAGFKKVNGLFKEAGIMHYKMIM